MQKENDNLGLRGGSLWKGGLYFKEEENEKGGILKIFYDALIKALIFCCLRLYYA